MAVGEVKRLEGWLSFEEAGEELGYSKQGIHRLIFESPHCPFDLETDVRGVGARPLMLLREAAVMAVKGRLDPDAPNGLTKIRPITDHPAEDT